MNSKLLLASLASASVLTASALPARAAETGQVLTAQTPVRVSDKPGRFDLLAVDSQRHRLLGAHSEAGTLSVVDLDTHKPLAEVPVGESSGIAIDDKDSKYFVGTTKGIAVVSPATLKQTAFITTPGPADAMVYDAADGKLYAGHDDGTELWVIGAASDKIVGTIGIPGVPELLDVDPATHRMYLNIKDEDEIAVIDTRQDKIITTWPTPQTHSPHGLVLDMHGGRVFIAGQSASVSVFSLAGGKARAAIDIGPGRVDQIAFDSDAGRLYCPSSGQLVVVDTSGTGSKLGSAPIPQGTHSVAVDPQTHWVWIAYADKEHSYVQAFAPAAGGAH